MVAKSNITGTSRTAQYPLVQQFIVRPSSKLRCDDDEIRALNSAGVFTVHVAVLPAGAMVRNSRITVSEAFNSTGATTATVKIGDTTVHNGTNLKAVAVQSVAPVIPIPTSPIPVTMTLTSADDAATVGVAVIEVEYTIEDRAQEVTPLGQDTLYKTKFVPA